MMKIEYFISKIVKVICELLNWKLWRQLTVSKTKKSSLLTRFLTFCGHFCVLGVYFQVVVFTIMLIKYSILIFFISLALTKLHFPSVFYIIDKYRGVIWEGLAGAIAPL